MFSFLLQLLSEKFLILGRLQRHIIINVHRSPCRVHFILVRFNHVLIFSTVFRKIVKFYENQASGNRVVPCGRIGTQTDGNDEATSRS